jgi:chlorite dismutase
VVAFESDKPEHFLDLVMELRHAEASNYTLRDTPIFTCVHRELPEMLDLLGG